MLCQMKCSALQANSTGQGADCAATLTRRVTGRAAVSVHTTATTELTALWGIALPALEDPTLAP